ncbi:hypothetical protein ZHAS_00016037 [Anopheles sinensis]|uniref:Cyclic nucleotide-binding domain-containing protein n=1 Tax=Anopheles sinensis TaxID=74873 RepID=A0A084WCX3_ANOSI|nr:hypothetical protein ZHAS_00016037 [Anopheles sinensis]
MKRKVKPTGHRCSLPGALRADGSETHLPPILPGTSLWARFFRYLRTLLLVSPTHPGTRTYYRSRTKVSAENERLVRDLPPFVVHPFSRFRQCWEAVIYCVLTLHLQLLAFSFAFAPHLARGMLGGLQLIDVGFCMVLGIEFALKLVTGYVAEDGVVVLDPRRIVRYRLRWWNVANRLLLIVPYVVLLDELVRAFYQDAALMYLALVVYLYVLCIWRFRTVGWYFRSIAQGMFGISGRQLGFIEPILDSLYVLHWTTCLVYIVPLLTVSVLGGSHSEANFLVDILWTHDHQRDTIHYPITHRARIEPDDFKHFLQEHLDGNHAEFFATKLEDLERNVTVPYRYLRALMITLKISLQGGHSLSVGNHFLHEWMQSLLLLGGWIWSTYVLLLLIRTLQTADASDTGYDETLNEIDAFCHTQRLSAVTNRKMARHVACRFRSRFFDERPILTHATDNVRRRLLTEFGVFRAFLARADVFRDFPPYLLEDISGRLRFELVLEEDTIVKAGSGASSMYFLASGTTAVYAPDGTELGHLIDGANFGAIALFRAGALRAVTVVALEVCELYKLDRSEFLQVMKPHTYFLAQLTKQMERRITEAAGLTLEDRLFDTFFY